MSRPAVLEQDPKEWTKQAIEYIETRAREVGTVTADDLARDLPEPHHPSVIGTVFSIASRRRLIQKYKPINSTRRSRHGGGNWYWVLHPDHLKAVA